VIDLRFVASDNRLGEKTERKLISQNKKEVSREIGYTIMNELYKLDPAAYIRFASVYNNFDPQTGLERLYDA
jgi:transcriptional regulator NrdR family protein